ncbi:fas-binding factor 1-like [Galendromus occidentalis]|uniref:Fas-binding factor 1-like n=1 Tax=Galendromus occidentalis TaxID=34638 RepID=A0AAJ7P935_9ACAR|nr:fas-binding factor 1-like [Galendromus occidentalis]
MHAEQAAMDDFDDFDNELDEILKNAVEEDKSKKPTVLTPSKSSARISLFDDEPRISQGAATSSKENTFLTALFGNSAPTKATTAQEAQRTSQVASSGPPQKLQSDADIDPLDAILSRTKARKAALQPRKQAHQGEHSEHSQKQTVAQEKIPTPQTRPKSPIEEILSGKSNVPRRDYSDYSSESEGESMSSPNLAQKQVQLPPSQGREKQEKKKQPGQARGGLLDVDSLAGINIKKSVDRKPRESDNAQPSVEAEPASINAHTSAGGVTSVAQKEISRKETRTNGEKGVENIGLERHESYGDQVEALRGQLELQRQLLLMKDEAIKQAQDSKSNSWRDGIEQKLEKLSTEQSSFLETIRGGFTDMRQRLSEEFELQKLHEEERRAREERIKLEQEQTRERFEIEVREKYEQTVDRINKANNLLVMKMKSEHERELMMLEKTKQEEIDQVSRAFDQTRSVRDLTNKVYNLVSRLEFLQHSLMSEFCEKMEKRLQMMERKILSGPARVDELTQRLSIIADKATEAQDETRSEVNRLRKEIRSFVDAQEDFRHMLLREHRGLVAQIVADRNMAQVSVPAPQAGRPADIKSSRVPTQSTNAAISQAMFIWRSYQQENL